jgi:hypothetical protein
MSPTLAARLTAALLLLPWGLAAQTGTITYERSVTLDRSALLDELVGGVRPGGRSGGVGGGRVPGGRLTPEGGAAARSEGGSVQEYATLTLTFDGTTALTRIETLTLGEGQGAQAGGLVGGRGRAGAAGRAQAGGRAGGPPGLPTRRTTALWIDATSDEKVEVVEFMSRQFRVVSNPAPLAWRLLGEESEYLGHVVQKAVAERDSALVEAWFTVDVAGVAAPEDYTGLPGVVLMVSVNRGETLIQAMNVQAGEPVEELKRPTDGEEITAEEFSTLVVEKTEEFRAEMQSRRRGGGGIE